MRLVEVFNALAARPNFLALIHNRIDVTQADALAATATAIQPITLRSAIARIAFNNIEMTANRSGVFVSSRAKYNGCKSFCIIKAGSPRP